MQASDLWREGGRVHISRYWEVTNSDSSSSFLNSSQYTRHLLSGVVAAVHELQKRLAIDLPKTVGPKRSRNNPVCC
jgi:hypothetical protein